MNSPSPRARFAASTLAILALLGSAACAATGNSSDPTSADQPTTSKPKLVSYELPPGMIENTYLPDGNPSQVHGVLGIPGTRWKGARPVVVVLHGVHDTCLKPQDLPDLAVTASWPAICQDERYLRSDVGMSWLVEELARDGFVAVSIDVAGAEQWWNGEASPSKGYPILIQAHLDLLSDFSVGKLHGLDLPALDGRIDTDQVALVGHSRAGGFISTKGPASIPGLFATVALEPQVKGPEDWAAQTVPVLNLRGQCDEEVTDKAGAETAAWLAEQGTSPHVLDVLVNGTTHWALNTGWAPGSFENPCTPAETARADDSRAQVGTLVGAFLTQSLAKEATYTMPDTGLLASAKDLATGKDVTVEKAAPGAGYADPTTINETSSTEAVLPPVPEDFNYDEAAGENY